MKNQMAVIIIFFAITSNAPEQTNLLTYSKTQDINFFKSIKNDSEVKEYITGNRNSVKIRDTLILGLPTSQEINTRTYGWSYGTQSSGGVAQSRSTSKKLTNLKNRGQDCFYG